MFLFAGREQLYRNFGRPWKAETDMKGFLNQQNESKRISDESAAIALEASTFLEEAGAVRAPGEAALYLARTDFLIRRAQALMERIRENAEGIGTHGQSSAPEAGSLKAAVAAQQGAALEQTISRLQAMRSSLKALAKANETASAVRTEMDMLHLKAGLMDTARDADQAEGRLLEKLKAGLEAERRKYE